MNKYVNPPCNSSLATFFHQFVEHVRRQCDLPCGSEFVPSGHQISCSSCCFPFPFECPRRECCLRERRGESCASSGETGWSRRRVQDWGGHWCWCGGRGWGRRCCWWRGRRWIVWIWIWGIHAVRDPSSQETRGESVRACHWFCSPSTMWVFKSSSIIINLCYWEFLCWPVNEFFFG